MFVTENNLQLVLTFLFELRDTLLVSFLALLINIVDGQELFNDVIS